MPRPRPRVEHEPASHGEHSGPSATTRPADLFSDPELDSVRTQLRDRITKLSLPDGTDPADATKLRNDLEGLLERFRPYPGQTLDDAVASLRYEFEDRVRDFAQDQRIDALIEEQNKPDMPMDKPGETPTAEMPADKPGEMPRDKPGETPMDKPGEMPADKPAEMPADKPGETTGEMPADKPGEMPADTPAETPAETPAGTPAAGDLPDVFDDAPPPATPENTGIVPPHLQGGSSMPTQDDPPPATTEPSMAETAPTADAATSAPAADAAPAMDDDVLGAGAVADAVATPAASDQPAADAPAASAPAPEADSMPDDALGIVAAAPEPSASDMPDSSSDSGGDMSDDPVSIPDVSDNHDSGNDDDVYSIEVEPVDMSDPLSV